MTELTKPVTRVTQATRYEKSQLRKLVLSIEPAGREEAVVGVRLQGTRQTYRLGIHNIYNLAVQLHLQKIDKLAKRLHKDEKVPMRSAKARARKELAKELG